MILTPSVRNTSSNGREYFGVPVPDQDLNPTKPLPHRHIATCWITQADFRFLVTPRTWTRLDPSSI